MSSRLRLSTVIVLGFALAAVLAWHFDVGGVAGRRDREDAATNPPALEVERESGDADEAALPGPVLVGRPRPPEPLAKDEGGCFGHVLHAATGTPVQGVPVYVVRLDTYHGKYVLLGSGRSDAEGRYRVRGMSAEDHLLTVVIGLGRGFVSNVAWPESWREEEHVPPSLRTEVVEGAWVAIDVRVRPATVVSGRVTRPGGAPAAAATVRRASRTEYGCFPWEVLPAVTADPEGRYVLSAVPTAPRLGVEARLSGYVAVMGEVPVPSGAEPVVVDLAFAPVHRAVIEVVDRESGAPVEGAKVRFEWLRYGVDDWGEAWSTVETEADGRARLTPVPTDGFGVSVRKDGYVTWGYCETNDWGMVRRESEPGVWKHRAELMPLSVIRGRIEWPADAPVVTGGFVRAVGRSETLNRNWREGADVASEGTFEVATPPDGSYQIKFFARQDGEIWRAFAVAEPGTTGLVLRPERVNTKIEEDRSQWGRWVLTLRDPSGRPLAATDISSEGGAKRHDLTLCPIDGLEEGRFEFLVEPGERSAWLSAWFARTVDGEVLGRFFLGPFGPEGGIRDVVFPEPRTIEGRVVGTGGSPVQGVQVVAEPVLPGRDYAYRDDAAFSDADGRFVLRNLLQATYDVEVQPSGGWVPPSPSRVEAGRRDLVFRLSETVTRTIRVADGGGRPVEDARVILWQRDGARGPDGDYDGLYLRTDADGVATATALEAGGTYTLKIQPPDDRPDLGEYQMKGWGPRDDDVALPGADLVSGVVRDAEGHAVADVEVWLGTADGELTGVATDAEGRFTFGGIVPGDVRLGACFREHHEKGWEPVWQVTVRSGARDVGLRLDDLRQLRVEIEAHDRLDRDLKRLDLTPLDLAVPVATKRVAVTWKGRAHVRGLEPGVRYRLWVGPSRSGLYVLSDVLAHEESVTVAVRQGRTLEGRVLVPRRAEDLRVRVTEAGVELRAKAIDDDGGFRLIGVPPGTWTLEASCSLEGVVRAQTLRIESGDRPLLDLRGP